MFYSEYLGKINRLYEQIEKIESDTISMLVEAGFESDEMSQELFDFSEIYLDLCSILAPSLNYYSYSRNTKDIKEKIEKVFFVAVCEMIKQDFNRGMIITFQQVTGKKDINTNRYYDLLQRVANSNNLTLKRQNGRRLFEQSFILETGIPKNLTKYVLKMFRIYWRYFKEIDYSERKEIIHSYLLGKELMDEYILDPRDSILFEEYKEYVKDFPEKSIRVFDKLDDIFSELDNYPNILENDNLEEIFDEISARLGFNIGTVLRDSDLKKIYSDYLKLVPIRKFITIVCNLPAYETIVLPDGRQMAAKNLQEKNIICGEYKIRGNKYSVIIDPVLSIEDMIFLQCNKVIMIATNYYFYSSKSDFYSEYNGKEISPRRVVYKQFERYVWMMRLAPASSAYVDGNIVTSSETYKYSLKVCKRFDYDKRQSVLQIHIGNVKINDQKRKYEKLFMSVNDKEKILLCVGSSQGIFYRENIRFDVGDTENYNICFSINEDEIFTDTVILKESYLFDKWNGTEYLTESINDRHSGSFVLFTKTKKMDNLDEDIKIDASYCSCGYYVYELTTFSKKKTLIIDGLLYSFERVGKPCVFLKNLDYIEELVQDIDNVELSLFNLVDDKTYRIGFENEKGRVVLPVTNYSFSLGSVDELKEIKCSGKWIVSLWEKQRKMDQITFTVIPQISFSQKETVTMEGKDITLLLSSNEKCFLSVIGEYVNSIEVNVGPGYFENENASFNAKPIDYYISIDSIGALKRISFIPNIWGVRTKKDGVEEWKHYNIISFNPMKPLDAKIAIVSNCNVDLMINGLTKTFFIGLTDIYISNILKLVKRKTELIVSDKRNKETIIIGCLPQYIFSNISMNETIVLSMLYAGPINEKFKINIFVDGYRSKFIERDAIKNKFIFHILLGDFLSLQGRIVSVEIVDSKGGIPKQVFKQEIPLEVISDANEYNEGELNNNKRELLDLSEYTNIEKIKQYYFANKSKNLNDLKLDSFFEKIGRTIW